MGKLAFFTLADETGLFSCFWKKQRWASFQQITSLRMSLAGGQRHCAGQIAVSCR